MGKSEKRLREDILGETQRYLGKKREERSERWCWSIIFIEHFLPRHLRSLAAHSKYSDSVRFGNKALR